MQRLRGSVRPGASARGALLAVFGAVCASSALHAGDAGPQPRGSRAASAEDAVERGAALDRALADLASASALQRWRAERWVAAHARPSDFASLADCAARGDAEVELRLARALGADDRHLGLALAFLGEKDPRLASIGRLAAQDALERFGPRFDEPFAALEPGALELRDALANARDLAPGEVYRLALDGTPAEVVDRLVRLSRLTLPVAVDPRLERSPVDRGDLAGHSVVGTWDQILLQLALVFGARLEGVIETGANEPVPLLVVLRAEGRVVRSAGDVLLEWCELSLEEGPGAAGAARALATSGWPAAMRWLEERWTERGDARALDGLLAAAGRGRVAPALARAESVRTLLAEADRALAEAARAPDASPRSAAAAQDARARALAIARALAELPPVGLDGARLDELLCSADSAAPEDALWLRFVALESMGGSGPLVTRAVDRAVEVPAAAASTRVRLQALRVRARHEPLHRESIELGGAAELFATAGDRDDARELAELVLAGDALLPEAWREPSAFADASPAARAAVFDVLFSRGEDRAAALWLAADCELEAGLGGGASTAAARVLYAGVLGDRVRAGDGARVALWLEGVRRGTAAPTPELAPGAQGEELARAVQLAVHELALLSGAEVPDADARDLALARALAEPSGSTEPPVADRELLRGCLAARTSPEVAEPARARLFDRLARALDGASAPPANDAAAVADTLRGLERAIADLFARGDDSAAKELVEAVRRAFRGRVGAPHSAEVLSWRWPVGRAGIVDLERLEREFGR